MNILRKAVYFVSLGWLWCCSSSDIRPEPSQQGASGQQAGGAGGQSASGQGGEGGTSGGQSPAAGQGGGGAAGSQGPGGQAGEGAGSSGASAGSGGSTGPGASAGTSGAAGTNAKDCPTGLPGPALVRVQNPSGTPYCIDSTEVTIGQYAKFLEANPNDDMSGLPEACKSNSSFKPFNKASEDVGDCPGYEFDPAKTNPDRPIQCVHWCDAYAYCQYAGKHLCGKVGGGSLAHKEAANPEVAQWYNACSQGGKTKFSYGDESDKDACFVETPKDNNAVPSVAEKPTCHGDAPPYDAIYNMSGSLYEWQDACEKESGDGQNVVCAVLGGTYNTTQTELSNSCQREALLDRISTGWGIGFRCCLD